jgi:hypothetical protein
MVYYGETKCQAKYGDGKICRNNAYFKVNVNYLCGVHSKKYENRIKLIKNPNKKALKEQQNKDRHALVLRQAEKNRRDHKKGKLVCTKLRMMSAPDHIDSFYKIFPNFKHQNRKDGFGCMRLSPKAMGPVSHGQPGLPIALNIENFHQFNKVFPSEVDENNDPTQIFYTTQIRGYLDPLPHRHKKEAVGSALSGTNKNIPLYSIWVDTNNNKKKITYFQSRQFYSNFYERIAKNLTDYKKLCDLLDDGYNLQLCGYDGFNVTTSL